MITDTGRRAVARMSALDEWCFAHVAVHVDRLWFFLRERSREVDQHDATLMFSLVDASRDSRS